MRFIEPKVENKRDEEVVTIDFSFHSSQFSDLHYTYIRFPIETTIEGKNSILCRVPMR